MKYPEKVEIRWYIAARPIDAGHLAVIGDTMRTRMYWDLGMGRWERDHAYATAYKTRREAQTAALLLVTQHPQYMGKLRISRKRLVWHPAPPPLNA